MNMKKIIILGVLVLVSLLCSCVKYNEPPMIYEPDTRFSESPLITSIVPADSAAAGIREIKINGTNFSANKHLNRIYFNNLEGKIKSSTENEIVLYRPPVFGDSIIISLEVHGSLQYAKKAYKIEQPISAYDNSAILNTRPSDPLMSIEIDRNETYIYLAKAYFIYRVPIDGGSIEQYKRFSGADFTRIYDIKFGPGGYLYIAASKNKIWRTQGEAGTSAETYVTLPSAVGVVDKIEFDQHGNLYTGKTKGLFVINTNKTVFNSNRYTSNFTFSDLKVFSDYIYINASYNGSDASIPKKAIWRNRIFHTNGQVDSVGQNEIVLNLSSHPQYANAIISSFTLDADGSLYLCLKTDNQICPLFIAEGGSLEPYYYDAILPQKVDQIIWGQGRYLYLNRGVSSYIQSDSAQLFRVGMVKTGAPYLGRTL